MEGSRDLAIQKIREYRVKYQAAQDPNAKYQAAEGFKTGVIALTIALKNEQNESIKNQLKKKLPDLEIELMTMFESSKIKTAMGQPPASQQPRAPQGNPTQQPKEPSKNNGPTEQKKEPAAKTQMQTNLEGAIVREKPNVKWEDVAGLEQAKKALKEAVILPIKFPEIFVGQRRPWKGILLYGPPGTGKTYLAKACATEMEQGTFFSISSSDLMSKYVGESEKTIKTLFQMARNEKPSIIFIDEIDSLTGNRSDGENEASRRVKTEFLVQMDGVGNETTGVLVLGATNTPWSLDPAIRRRFERRIYIPLPEVRARLGLIINLIKNNPNELSEEQLEHVAERTEGQHLQLFRFSGSDISVLVRDAMFEPLRFSQIAKRFVKITENGQPKWTPCSQTENNPGCEYRNCSMNELPQGSLRLPHLTLKHFEMALLKSKPSVSLNDLSRYIDWTKDFGQDG